MRFDLLEFFRKFPRLAAVLLALATVFSASKAWYGAKVEGFLPGLDLHQAKVIAVYTKDSLGRYGSTRTDCYATAIIDRLPKDVRIDCEEMELIDAAEEVTYVVDGSSLSSIEFERGHFYIDFALLMLEIYGVFYFARLGRKKVLSLSAA